MSLSRTLLQILRSTSLSNFSSSPHLSSLQHEQHKTHSNPFRNDFQYTRNYESGNMSLIDNADRLGRPTTELSLSSHESGTFGRCCNAVL